MIHGSGIPKEGAKTLFEALFQIGPGLKNLQRGNLGLGPI